jgi:hypothetical protein
MPLVRWAVRGIDEDSACFCNIGINPECYLQRCLRHLRCSHLHKGITGLSCAPRTLVSQQPGRRRCPVLRFRRGWKKAARRPGTRRTVARLREHFQGLATRLARSVYQQSMAVKGFGRGVCTPRGWYTQSPAPHLGDAVNGCQVRNNLSAAASCTLATPRLARRLRADNAPSIVTNGIKSGLVRYNSRQGLCSLLARQAAHSFELWCCQSGGGSCARYR